MNRPRDSQRARVYRAEASIDQGMRLGSVMEMQQYLDRILASRWWKNQGLKLRKVVVKDGRGRRRAGAFVNGNAREAAIAMPRWSRHELTVLHELAHCWTTAVHGERVASHGPEFARNMLELTNRSMGVQSGLALRQAFVQQGVKWHPSQ